jgi:hypothetical protein
VIGLRRSARFLRYFIMNELLKSAIIAGTFTLFVCIVFVVTYWAFRGFLPGSKVVEMPLPAPNDLDGKTATFKLFHVKWCPHSREAFDKVQELKSVVEQFTFGGKRVKIQDIDCELDKGECSLYKVDAYPTYKLETSVKMFEYLGPSDLQTYQTFLESALGKKQPINA